MHKHQLTFIFVLILFAAGCKSKPSGNEAALGNGKPLTESGVTIADSLIYDVIIKSLDPESEWENIRVKGMNREAFVKSIFESIYTGKYLAFDFFTQEPISIDSVRLIEKQPDFNIDKVSKVQFTEHWEMLESGELVKRVDAMTLGLEHYSAQGTFIGHKALFTVKLKGR